ncbi:hypothetical protein [Actinoplanes sp. HUAS TT8]|uniref:hypothetical protein n=1 Tax=Actinoplanes sp. HUAS TT8 TaxID=3447453 RepID=UPI003F51F6EA
MYGIPEAASTWDWEVHQFDGSRLRLAADNDLTYAHGLEVVLTDLAYMACPTQFTNPRFREPTPAERRLVQRHCGDEPAVILAFDVESAHRLDEWLPCLIAADAIQVVPGTVYRYWRDDLKPGERLSHWARRPDDQTGSGSGAGSAGSVDG